MEYIVPIILAALKKLSETTVLDSYSSLKDLIAEKFGKDSDLSEYIEKLEKKPESKGRKEILKEEIIAVKADQDKEILKAVQQLENLLNIDNENFEKSNSPTMIHQSKNFIVGTVTGGVNFGDK